MVCLLLSVLAFIALVTAQEANKNNGDAIIKGAQYLSLSKTGLGLLYKAGEKVPQLGRYLPSGVGDALKNNRALGYVGALPNFLDWARDVGRVANAPTTQGKAYQQARLHVSSNKLGESLATSTLSTFGGLYGGAVSNGISAGELVFKHALARPGNPTSLGELSGMYQAIKAHNGGNGYRTAGQIAWEMANDSRAKESAKTVHGIAGRAAQSIGKLGLIADWGFNKLLGREDKSALAVQAREHARAPPPRGIAGTTNVGGQEKRTSPLRRTDPVLQRLRNKYQQQQRGKAPPRNRIRY